MIVAAAIKYEDGKIYIGRRHDLIIKEIYGIYQKTVKRSNPQGFVNEFGEFRDRETAQIEAHNCGQITGWRNMGLDSSDMQDDPCYMSEAYPNKRFRQ